MLGAGHPVALATPCHDEERDKGALSEEALNIGNGGSHVSAAIVQDSDELLSLKLDSAIAIS
jgi:hypothetical protein